MKAALFSGTFDPPTLGHLEIIERASALFDRLYVGISQGNLKGGISLSWKERQEYLKAITVHLKNVEVIAVPGLTVDSALEKKVKFLVRGLRNSSDFDFEAQMAATNRQMTGVETVLLIASPAHSHINSTLVREIASQGRRLHGFVPEAIEEKVFVKLSGKRVSVHGV